jgi:hypothetical protein
MVVDRASLNTEATFHEASGVSLLAKVLVRNKRENAGNTIQTSGAMSRFQLVEGDLSKLRKYWWRHTAFRLRVNNTDSLVRLSAMPTEKGGEGYIEFL